MLLYKKTCLELDGSKCQKGMIKIGCYQKALFNCSGSFWFPFKEVNEIAGSISQANPNVVWNGKCSFKYLPESVTMLGRAGSSNVRHPPPVSCCPTRLTVLIYFPCSYYHTLRMVPWSALIDLRNTILKKAVRHTLFWCRFLSNAVQWEKQ